MRRSRTDSALLFLTALAAGAFLGARNPGELVRASLLSGFELESVAASGVSRLSAAQVARLTGLSPGVPLAEVDGPRVEARLLRHPWIRRARVAPLPPGRVLVEVVEREPVAVAQLGRPPRPWLLDEEGTPFAEAVESEWAALPVLHGGAPTPGEPSPRLAKGIRLIRAVAARGLPSPREVWLEAGNEGLVLELPGVPARVVLGTGPLPPRLQRLTRLLAEAPGEVAGAASIDLRFGDRVVLRSGPSADGGRAVVDHAGGTRPERSQSG